MKITVKPLMLLVAGLLMASCGGNTPASSTSSTESAPSSSSESTSSEVSSSEVVSSKTVSSDTCSISISHSSSSGNTYVEGELTEKEKGLFANFNAGYADHVYGFAIEHTAEYDARNNLVNITINNGSKAFLDSYVDYLAYKNYTVKEDDESTSTSGKYFASLYYNYNENEYAITAQLYNFGTVVYVDFYYHVSTKADMTSWEADAVEVFNDSFYEGASSEFVTYQKDTMTCYTGYVYSYGCLLFTDTNAYSQDIIDLRAKTLELGYEYVSATQDDREHYTKFTEKGEYRVEVYLTEMLNLYYYCYYWALN